MKQYRYLLYSLLLLTLSWQVHAQNVFDAKAADSVTLHPRMSNNDTTYYAALPQITVQHHYRLRFAPPYKGRAKCQLAANTRCEKGTPLCQKAHGYHDGDLRIPRDTAQRSC